MGCRCWVGCPAAGGDSCVWTTGNKTLQVGTRCEAPVHSCTRALSSLHVPSCRFEREEGEERLPCMCGAPNCSGFLN